MALEALIFDVDGTLAETERDGHRVAFNLAFSEAGLDWNWSVDEYARLLAVAGGKERILHYRQQAHPDFHPSDDLPAWSAQLHKAKSVHYKAMVQAGKIPLRPGVLRLLNEARSAGLRLAIATTTTPENVTSLLETHLGPEGIGWFEVIAAGDIVPKKKPAPDIYTYALDQLNLPADRCLAFEDTNQGLRSAMGADLKTVVTINDYTKAQDFTGATLVLDQFGEPNEAAQVLAGSMANTHYFDVASAQALMA
jgi:beta-phosphoglucomutase-like phosphatase (HAD superfamily)